MRQQELVRLLAEYDQLARWMEWLFQEVQTAERRWAELRRRLAAVSLLVEPPAQDTPARTA